MANVIAIGRDEVLADQVRALAAQRCPDSVGAEPPCVPCVAAAERFFLDVRAAHGGE